MENSRSRSDAPSRPSLSSAARSKTECKGPSGACGTVKGQRGPSADTVGAPCRWGRMMRCHPKLLHRVTFQTRRPPLDAPALTAGFTGLLFLLLRGRFRTSDLTEAPRGHPAFPQHAAQNAVLQTASRASCHTGWGCCVRRKRSCCSRANARCGPVGHGHAGHSHGGWRRCARQQHRGPHSAPSRAAGHF